MLRFLSALSMLLAMNVSVATKPAEEASRAIPDDGLDDAPALQRAIDALWRQGGGTLRLSAGEFDLATPLLMRSGVTLSGAGGETHLTGRNLNHRARWAGVTLFAGNLAPVNYSGENGGGYAGRRTIRTDQHSLELSDCTTIDVPPEGAVVWLSGDPVVRGRRGAPHSPHDEMNSIASRDGCSLRLSLPISAPMEHALALHFADGSVLGPGGVPQAPIRDAVLSNVSLSSENSQALIVSGCFQCVIEQVHIGRSRRLLPVQGSRSSHFENIHGTFHERGIEFAAYATENVVVNVTGNYESVQGYSPRPAIRFGEFARDNTLRDVRLTLGPSYLGKIKIRFDESIGNRLSTIRLVMPGRDDPARAVVYRGPGEDRASNDSRPPDTDLEDVALCTTGPGEAPCRALR